MEPDITEIIGTAIKVTGEIKATIPEECVPDIDAPTKRDARSSWSKSGNDYIGIGITLKELTPGCYEGDYSGQIGHFLTKLPIVTDDLLILPDTANSYILDEFSRFWEMKTAFTERGFIHKRGILLYGPPGSGKTSSIQLIIKDVVEKLKGVVLIVKHPGKATGALKLIREIEPNRPTICILEDIDALVTDYGESAYLEMLDGEAQVDNVLFVATTNYPERLDARFIDRPSRFDTIKYIGMPSAEARKFYLQAKESSLTEEELNDWVEKTNDLSIPHLKELIISVKCYGRSLEETLERLKKMHKKKLDSNNNTLGFK